MLNRMDFPHENTKIKYIQIWLNTGYDALWRYVDTYTYSSMCVRVYFVRVWIWGHVWEQGVFVNV